MFTKKTRRAFTLLEILVSLALLCTASGLCVAAYAKTLAEANVIRCLSQLRQIGVAAHQYAMDNHGQLPQSTHQGKSRAWGKVLKAYGIPAAMFISPLDRTGRSQSYAVNDYVTEHPYGAETADFSRIPNIPAPSQTLFMAVMHPGQQNTDHFHFADPDGGYSPSSFKSEVWVEMANGGGNYLYVDGHAQCLKWTEIQTELLCPDTRFIRPDGIN